MTRDEILARYPNLYGADLRGADLHGADLRGADLRGADLHDADLHDADLRDADLRGANLRGANLHGADLHDADLRDANLSGARGLVTLATPPEEGAFIAYKAVRGRDGAPRVLTVRIPAGAARTGSYVGRKCRAAFVEVVSGAETVCYGGGTGLPYANGDRAEADSYDPDPRVECTHGIHFFMAYKEADEYLR